MHCVWCGGTYAFETAKDCLWIEPGGTERITVTDIPAIHCPKCRDTYLDDEVNEEIEAALNTVDMDKLGTCFSYIQLMQAPRISIFEMIKRGDRFNCHG